jgi:hypothetical protein
MASGRPAVIVLTRSYLLLVIGIMHPLHIDT